jgi:hypothetical protein
MLKHQTQGLQIGLSNSMGIHFSALGPILGHKVQHLLVTLGGLKRFFSSLAFDS